AVESVWPTARIGLHEGQASAFYNVSGIERAFFEMWYFDNLGAYKAAAHGAPALVRDGHARLVRSLENIRREAATLRDLGNAESAAKSRPDPSELWLKGAYSDLNRERN
ncbi:MAG: hydroxylamine oxidoreductase, partial [Alphaproteobacteria bacterium]|nr:hydroxylamine oxidoreductase [Alphaproteobacteria bacterium]